MEETVTQVVDLLFKIGAAITWLVMFFKLIHRKVVAKKAQNTLQKVEDKILENKENQLEEEEKDMANYLCDKCGAKQPVAEAIHLKLSTGHEVDVCTTCAAKVKTLEAKVEAATQSLSEAQKAYDAAKAELLKFDTQESVPTSRPDPTPKDANADILAKLGVK